MFGIVVILNSGPESYVHGFSSALAVGISAKGRRDVIKLPLSQQSVILTGEFFLWTVVQ